MGPAARQQQKRKISKRSEMIQKLTSFEKKLAFASGYVVESVVPNLFHVIPV